MMRSGQGCSTSTNRFSLIDTLPNELKRPLAIGMEFLSPVDLKKTSSPQLLGTDFDGASPRVLSPVLDSELVESEVEHLGNGTHGTHKLVSVFTICFGKHDLMKIDDGCFWDWDGIES